MDNLQSIQQNIYTVGDVATELQNAIDILQQHRHQSENTWFKNTVTPFFAPWLDHAAPSLKFIGGDAEKVMRIIHRTHLAMRNPDDDVLFLQTVCGYDNNNLFTLRMVDEGTTLDMAFYVDKNTGEPCPFNLDNNYATLGGDPLPEKVTKILLETMAITAKSLTLGHTLFPAYATNKDAAQSQRYIDSLKDTLACFAEECLRIDADFDETSEEGTAQPSLL